MNKKYIQKNYINLCSKVLGTKIHSFSNQFFGLASRLLKEEQPIFKEGVYDKNMKLISEIKPNEAEKLIYDETISEGMIPKIRTCIDVVNNGVRGVVIIDGRKPHSILFELFSDQGSGTLIRK